MITLKGCVRYSRGAYYYYVLNQGKESPLHAQAIALYGSDKYTNAMWQFTLTRDLIGSRRMR